MIQPLRKAALSPCAILWKLRTIKSHQQFIFATHNANFPVLGDAETVSSCVADGDTITVETGSIDSRPCQEKIVRIMEGVREAFERRKTVYQIWSASTKPTA